MGYVRVFGRYVLEVSASAGDFDALDDTLRSLAASAFEPLALCG